MVRIVNTTGLGHNTQLFDKEGNNMAHLLSIRSIHMEAGEVIVAQADIIAPKELDTEAELIAFFRNKPIQSITLRDGTVYKFPL